MTIAICDDNKSDISAAKEVMIQTAQELHIKVEFDTFSSAAEVEDKLLVKKEPVDILILDIDMPEISGLELAEKLRASNLELIIIFLSAHEEFVFKAIEFQPFRYIRKIRMSSEMPIAIRSAVRVLQINSDKQIALHTDDGDIKVMISEIVYFETEKRKVAVHLKNGISLLVNKTIYQIQEMIDKQSFIMIHRSCVVNADYVKKYSNGIILLDNDEKLLVSRTRYKAVKQQLLDIWGEM